MEEMTLREKIIAAEWEMFQATNNKGGRASCQDDYKTFRNMRSGQFDAWSDECCESYLDDLWAAELEGRNLIAEKYLNMMKNTFPAEYEKQKHFLPYMSEKKLALADEICDEMIAQTVPLREFYPHVGDSGRPLYSKDDRIFTSVQTYQLGELLTYSEKTLELLKKHIFALKEEGKSLAREILRNSVCSYGFTSLEQAEEYLGKSSK